MTAEKNIAYKLTMFCPDPEFISSGQNIFLSKTYKNHEKQRKNETIFCK